VSEVRRGVADLPAQWAQARAAARVAAAVAHLSPVAHWAELGAWRAITELGGPDPVVVPLLADRVLAETAEAFLDCAGSASRAAAALQIHRQTLYYRLTRIGELTGLDLADGEARLLLHTSLKAARLVSAATARSTVA
jgi:DNA-binding PucR family transcriptional regulator